MKPRGYERADKFHYVRTSFYQKGAKIKPKRKRKKLEKSFQYKEISTLTCTF